MPEAYGSSAYIAIHPDHMKRTIGAINMDTPAGPYDETPGYTFAWSNGATTEDMKFGIRQLSQGLTSQVFRAEEYNSVLENTPAIMNEIAKGMSKSVPQLRQMVLDGELLAKDVFKALVDRADEVAAAFAKIPPDMARGIQATKTGLTVLFGQIDKSLRLTRTLAQGAFDFGNFLAKDSTLKNALMLIAQFKVYFNNFIIKPAQEAFNFLSLSFNALQGAIGQGFDGFLDAASDINTAKGELSTLGKVALTVGTLLASNLIGPVLAIGGAFIKVAGIATGVFSPAVMLVAKSLNLISPIAAKAVSGVLRFGAALLLNPIGIFIAGIFGIRHHRCTF